MIGDIFQPTHLLFLLVIVLLVLGPKRLPEVARSLGRGFRDFKDAISGEDRPGYHELHQQPFPSSSASVTPDPMHASHAAEPVAAPSEDFVPEAVTAPSEDFASKPVATSPEEHAGAPVAAPVDTPTEEPPTQVSEPEPVGTPGAKDPGNHPG